MLSLSEKQSLLPIGNWDTHALDNTQTYTYSAEQVVKLYKIYNPWKGLNGEGGVINFFCYKRGAIEWNIG